MDLKIGDIVKLKSGSPKMTVADVGKYGYSEREQVKCVWFDGNKRIEDLFEKDSLKVINSNSSAEAEE